MVGPTDVYVGERVHELLWRKRVQQRVVYEAMGLSRSSLAKKMRGTTGWSLDDLVAVKDVLDVTWDELLPRMDSNHQPSGCRVSRGFAAQAFTTTPIPAGWRATRTNTEMTRWTGWVRIRDRGQGRGNEGGMP